MRTPGTEAGPASVGSLVVLVFVTVVGVCVRGCRRVFGISLILSISDLFAPDMLQHLRPYRDKVNIFDKLHDTASQAFYHTYAMLPNVTRGFSLSVKC